MIDSNDEQKREEFVLGRARAGLSPSRDQRRATMERLALGLGLESALPEAAGEGPPNPDLPSEAPAAVGGLSSSSLKALFAGAVGVASVSFGTGYWVGQRSPVESVAAPVVQTPAAVVESTPSPSEEAEGPAVYLEFEEDPVDDAPPPVAVPRSVVDAVPDKKVELSGAAKPTFYQELSYVRRAQSALGRGDGALALGLMMSLEELQPGGALLAERRVTRVLALCQLGRQTEAVVVARSALENNTTEVYRRRLRASCAGEGLGDDEQEEASESAPGDDLRESKEVGVGEKKNSNVVKDNATSNTEGEEGQRIGPQERNDDHASQ